MTEGRRNRMIIEFTGDGVQVGFVPREDQESEEASSEDLTGRNIDQAEPTREPINWPLIISAGDRLRGLGHSSVQGSAWGD